MQMTFLWRRALLVVWMLAPLSCRTTGSGSKSLSEGARCRSPIVMQAFVNPSIQCVESGYYLNAAEAAKRKLISWIPCNSVERIDGSIDLFGPSNADTPENIRQSTFGKVYFDWLIPADRFTPQSAAESISKRGDGGPPTNPITDTAMLRKIHELIEGAQHNIIMDIFLFGGSLGEAITRDLARAADRGVEVVLLHDNVSKFIVANEMDPLWTEILKFSRETPNFVALEANIRTPMRVSSIPAGLERISSLLGGVVDLGVALDGKSDHSKILMIDTLFTTSLDEYKSLVPKAMVSSHNLVDSAASFYHDEAVVVTGPAAVSAMLSYRSDIDWAYKQAKVKGPALVSNDSSQLEAVLKRMNQVAVGPTEVSPRGETSVQPLEVSANDEIRNLDTSIIPRIMAARSSIDLYGKIAYNWPMAIALKDAMARGVQVRIILDQQTANSALLNAVLPYMIVHAPLTKRIPARGQSGGGGGGAPGAQDSKESMLPLRWFLPFRPTQAFPGQDRSGLSQEIHAKTIIIDQRWSLYGSANLDTFGWAGGFREYSVWVDDTKIANEASRFFNRLWGHKFLTVSHAVWIGAEQPDPEVTAYFTQQASSSTCVKGADCDASRVLQGGKAYQEKGAFRELIRNITALESKRIRQAFPINIPVNDQGQPTCF